MPEHDQIAVPWFAISRKMDSPHCPDPAGPRGTGEGRRRRSNLPIPAEEASAASILTSICPDAEGDCSSSVVSEITAMTYRAEWDRMVREEFVRRAICIQVASGVELTREDKEAILRDVVIELKRREEDEEYEEEDRQQQQNDKNSETLHEPGLPGQAEDGEHHDEVKNIRHQVTTWGDDDDDVERQGASSSSLHRLKNKLASSFSDWNNLGSPFRSAAPLRVPRRSISFSLFGTFKHRNAAPGDRMDIHGRDINDWWDEDLSATKSDIEEIDYEETRDTWGVRILQENKRGRQEQVHDPEAAYETTSTCGAHIDDIVDLKVLVANQQATIDTLCANLHNLKRELARRQFPPICDDGDLLEAVGALQDENRHLASELSQSREREASWRMEANSQRELLEDSYREQLQLEEENHDLLRENLELRHMLGELRKGEEPDGDDSDLNTRAASASAGAASAADRVSGRYCLYISKRTEQTVDTTIADSIAGATHYFC